MYIGVDVGGTNIVAGLVSKGGEIIKRKSCPTGAHRNPDKVIGDIIKLIERVIDTSSIKRDILGIGIGIPGISDKDTGNVFRCVNLGWNNVPLKEVLEKHFRKPVLIDNDASVAAVAEYEIGRLKNKKNSMLITLGTGVGGGLIINGKPYSGSNRAAGELGHMIVGENYYDCNCGQNGCLETFTSATALINYTKKLMTNNNNTLIYTKIDGDINEINAKTVFDCAKEGDLLAREAVDRLVRYLAIGINNIANVIDIDAVAIGGGVSKAGDYLIELIKKEVQKNKLFPSIAEVEIKIAKLGNEAGIIGAAMLCKYR